MKKLCLSELRVKELLLELNNYADEIANESIYLKKRLKEIKKELYK